MCKLETSWEFEKDYLNEIPEILLQLMEMEDGLLNCPQKNNGKGRPFVKGIYMANLIFAFNETNPKDPYFPWPF